MNKQDYILKETFRLLNEKYPIGLYEYLYEYQTDRYQELQDIEENIDKAYLKGTVDELKLALREYWTFHMKVIKEFKQDENKQKDLIKARKEMMEERIQA